jgi:hypothetical protein
MKLILTLELIFWLFVAYFIIRQIVVPLWKNEKTLPMFRTRRELEAKLRDTKTAVGDYEVFQQIRAEAEKLPPPVAPDTPTQILPKTSPVKTTPRKPAKR